MWLMLVIKRSFVPICFSHWLIKKGKTIFQGWWNRWNCFFHPQNQFRKESSFVSFFAGRNYGKWFWSSIWTPRRVAVLSSSAFPFIFHPDEIPPLGLLVLIIGLRFYDDGKADLRPILRTAPKQTTETRSFRKEQKTFRRTPLILTSIFKNSENSEFCMKFPKNFDRHPKSL